MGVAWIGPAVLEERELLYRAPAGRRADDHQHPQHSGQRGAGPAAGHAARAHVSPGAALPVQDDGEQRNIGYCRQDSDHAQRQWQRLVDAVQSKHLWQLARFRLRHHKLHVWQLPG